MTQKSTKMIEADELVSEFIEAGVPAVGFRDLTTQEHGDNSGPVQLVVFGNPEGAEGELEDRYHDVIVVTDDVERQCFVDITPSGPRPDEQYVYNHLNSDDTNSTLVESGAVVRRFRSLLSSQPDGS